MLKLISYIVLFIYGVAKVSGYVASKSESSGKILGMLCMLGGLVGIVFYIKMKYY